jgi:serine phosphatase RsbU (regulator of sigma subunit)
VGGDFFQILPLEGAGNALIVVGDVTGKGVQAGMLVALIVGAIRSVAQQTQAPEQILRRVNDQLCERQQAGATCMVMRISAEGVVQIAHAGHVPPYLNDQELKLEGALPLGMFAGVDFSSETFRLNPGDTLTLFSDGVSEAQDSRGNLFGFDRVHQMMSGPVTAADIAAAAQRFGQEDDITVLQVQWEGLEPSMGIVAEPQLAAL